MTTMQSFTRKTVVALCVTGVCTLAFAKLPAPSPEAAAKAAWAGKVDNYKLCLSQDKVAAHYRKTTPSAKPAAATGAACTDPGPFAYTPPAAKPAEAAGAHPPPGTASSPPSTQVPAAAAAPASKS
jgi:hypothetical protein